MKIGKTFIKLFLTLFLAVVLLNVSGLIFGFYNNYLLYSLLVFIGVLCILVLRKIGATKTLKFFSVVIPIAILLAVLYVNFLPFGYSKDYKLSVDENGSVTSSSENIMLQDSKDNAITNLTNLSSFKSINLVLTPEIILRNANIHAELKGENVSFKIAPKNLSTELDFNIKNVTLETVKMPIVGQGYIKEVSVRIVQN